MTDHSGSEKLKLFISYSRRDSSKLAEELVNGLELLGFAPFLDRHDIAAAEDWETRLASLIAAADTVVFIISPEAVRSDRCAWEVDKACELSKRVIPVVGTRVTDADVPPTLTRLNYIFFNEGHSFTRSLAELATALRTDVAWIREHTRLAELAARWRSRGEPEALLLRADELHAAQEWMANRAAAAPELTDLHRAFITASADAETARINAERERLQEITNAQLARAEALEKQEIAVKRLARRTTVALIGAGALTVVAGALAYWATLAEQRFREQQRRADEAYGRSVDAAIQKEAMRTNIEGQLSAFSTGPRQFAPAGVGDPSYSHYVLTELSQPGNSLQNALAAAHSSFRWSSGTGQQPFLSSDMNGDIYLQQQPGSRRRRAIVISMDRITRAGKPVDTARDAIAWKNFLESKGGFDVVLLRNPDASAFRREMAKASFRPPPAIRSSPFAETIRQLALPPSDTLLFLFFSGAGAYDAGTYYLRTADAGTDTKTSVHQGMMPLSEIQDQMRDSAAASVLILDTAFLNVDRPAR